AEHRRYLAAGLRRRIVRRQRRTGVVNLSTDRYVRAAIAEVADLQQPVRPEFMLDAEVVHLCKLRRKIDCAHGKEGGIGESAPERGRAENGTVDEERRIDRVR